MLRPLRRPLLGLGAAILAGSVSIAQTTLPQSQPSRTLTIEIPLSDGKLTFAGVSRGLLDALGFDGREIHVDESRPASRPASLVLRFDRDQVQRFARKAQSRAATWLRRTGDAPKEDRYALELPARLDATRVLVVLIHGWEAKSDAWDDLKTYLTQSTDPFQVATFGWPKDAAIQDVAAELSSRLRLLQAQPVALVGHSTGGLIGRLVVEDPKLDPSNVKVLIQIGTPNQGSVLAGLPLALEWTRVFWDREANGSVHRVLGTLRQSLANALDGTGRDLMPDSDLLTLAASRPRNRNVVYHSVLGTRSLLTSEQAESVRKWASVQLAGSSFGRTLKPKVERWLDNPDELIDGRGDGAVSVASGRLEGVEAVLVALDHYGLIRRNGVLSRTPYGEDHPVFTYVKSWLSEIR